MDLYEQVVSMKSEVLEVEVVEDDMSVRLSDKSLCI